MFKIDIPACAKRLIYLLEQAGYEAFVVGGCVRDSLLHILPHDWDICTSARPEEVCAIMAANNIRIIETGLQHGTVTACYGINNYEITTFRMDGDYSDNRRPDRVEFVGDVIEDLARRDFTINAMAYNESYGVIDPWNGSYDLHAGLIRCVRNPDDRFREDGLRIMRALRFASTYGFRIEKKTAAAIHRNKELLKNISAERIQSELTKMLCGKGVLDILLDYKDVMAVIIPELSRCIGFEQNNKFHKYTVYEHIAHAVANHKGSDISVKMALLLHDTGKPECYTEDENGGHFHGHSVPSMHIAKDVMTRLKFDSTTRDEVVDLVLYHDADIQPNVRSIKRWLNKVGPDMLEKLMVVREYDIYAQSDVNQIPRIDKCRMIFEMAREVVIANQCFQIKDLVIDGNDVINLGAPEGPVVGNVLKHVLDKVIADELENEREALIKEAKDYIEEGRQYQFCLRK